MRIIIDYHIIARMALNLDGPEVRQTIEMCSLNILLTHATNVKCEQQQDGGKQHQKREEYILDCRVSNTFVFNVLWLSYVTMYA